MPYTPNPARIAIVPSPFDGNAASLSFPVKGTQETLDYSVDFTKALALTGDSIVSFTTTQRSDDGSSLTISAVSGAPVTPITSILASGGNDGVHYRVTFAATCASGLVIQADTFLDVSDATEVPPSTVQFLAPGVRGPRGFPGSTGPAGANGTSVTSATISTTGELQLGLSNGQTLDAGAVRVPTEYSQITPASVWTITHNLNRHPAVTVVDSAGTVVEGDVSYASRNQIVLSFAVPFAGNAYLS